MKILQAIEVYQFFCGINHLSKSTLEIKIWVINQFTQFLDDMDTSKIIEDDLDRFIFWLSNDYKPQYKVHLSTSSIVNAWKGLRSYFG